MKPINVVIDCDPGIDDTLALLYALKNPKLNVKAITIVGGNVNEVKGEVNARALVSALSLNIPVYRGSHSDRYIDAEDTHGENGLGNSLVLEPYYQESHTSSITTASEYLAHITKEDQITVIALGPLTNIWGAYKLNTKFFHNVDKIVSMGGAYRTHGNCSPVSEYNYWCDPDSAKAVFSVLPKDFDFTIIPLDVTRKIVLTNDIVEDIKWQSKSTGDLVESITNFYMDFHKKQESIDGCVINDPLAVCYVVDNSLCQGDTFYCQVCPDEGPTRGQLLVDTAKFYREYDNAQVCTQVNVPAFWEDFIQVICY